ncbi:MAG: HNH endonuclease [Candidatus Binatia bacterium]
MAFAAPGEGLWSGLERLLRHVIREWESQPPHRDPIFARDGWRCSVPACSGRRSLEDHHIVFRSRGGANEQWNRLSVCASHHHHAVHRYVIRASGHAPDAVVWELGLGSGRTPFLVLHGERYLRPIAL